MGYPFELTLGGALIALALGIVRRRAFAWRLGSGALGLLLLDLIVRGLVLRAEEPEDIAEPAPGWLFTTFGIGAIGCLSYVWTRQRDFFRASERSQ